MSTDTIPVTGRRRRVSAIAVLLLAASVRTAQAQTCQVNELTRLTPADGTHQGYFGNSISVSADVALIGAYADDAGAEDSGSAYVFRWDGSDWVQDAKLTTSDAARDDYFGFSVSISGGVAVIGAVWDDDAGDYAGSAYVFRWDGDDWEQQAKLAASDGALADLFGWAVSISGDTAVIGAPGDDNATGYNAGSAYVFRLEGDNWVQQAKLSASDGYAWDEFGDSVSLSADVAVVGAPGDDNDGGYHAGSAYVFRRDGEDWLQQAKLTASDGQSGDHFGRSICISGDEVVIGAPGDGDGASDSGSAYVFRGDGSDWVQQAKLTASDPAYEQFLGVSVSISGDVVLIGAPGDDDGCEDCGSAYVFGRNGSEWVQQAKLTASDAHPYNWLGTSVSITNDMAMIGAPLGIDGDIATGAAYIFRGLSDCNANGILDICDVADGTSPDDNGNGIPDECDCPGDLNRDWVVDLIDLATLLVNYGKTTGMTYYDGDLDSDGDMDLADLAELLARYGETCE